MKVQELRQEIKKLEMDYNKKRKKLIEEINSIKASCKHENKIRPELQWGLDTELYFCKDCETMFEMSEGEITCIY